MKKLILSLAFLSLSLSAFADEPNIELIHRLDQVANRSFRAPGVCDLRLSVDTAATPPALKHTFTGNGCKAGGVSSSANCSPEGFKCGDIELDEDGGVTMYGTRYQRIKNTLYKCRCYLGTNDTLSRDVTFIRWAQFELQTGMDLGKEAHDACDVQIQNYKSTIDWNPNRYWVTARGCMLVNP